MSGFGRGEADTVRDKSVKVRLSEDEKNRLDALAQGMGMTVASLVRFLCITNIQSTFVGGHALDSWAKVRDYSEYKRALNEFSNEVVKTRAAMNKVGSNVNQIARALNERKPVDASMCRSMRESRDCLNAIYAQLKTVADGVEKLSVPYERLGDE